MSYQAPLDDITFALDVHANLDQLLTLKDFNELDRDTIKAIIEEAGHFTEGIWSESNSKGDKNGANFENGTTVNDPIIRQAFEEFRAAGWPALRAPIEFGGQGIPTTISAACEEMWYGGNVALSLLPMLTNGAISAIHAHASKKLKQKFIPKMADNTWAGTMNLTEPQAGSDLAGITTKAVPLDDGTYAISGQKIFITWGEHDFTENIIHLVLARVPNAPAGTKGISLFIVPKFWVNEDDSLGERNTVSLVSVEHKLGIHASPTCVLQFEEAKGYLVGEENSGLAYMFTMMNHARLGVGIEGCGIAEAAFQHAKQYATERIQSRDITSKDRNAVTIIHHPDVKRMLLIQKATIEAQRALYIETAFHLDLATQHPDETQKATSLSFVEYMIPVVKAFSTENSIVLTNLAIQIFGGMGYIEETGTAQFMRDARITTIYEGTTGIQAMDSVGRKTAKNNGSVAFGILADGEKLIELLTNAQATSLANQLNNAIDLAKKAVDFVIKNYNSDKIGAVAAGAVSYLMQIGTTLGAIALAKDYLNALKHINQPTENSLSPTFYKSKLKTVEVYFSSILPNIESYYLQLTLGGKIIAEYPVDEI